MLRSQVREGVWSVGQALRDPEEFADRWNLGEAHYPTWVWLSLTGTAILGTTTYGMTMGLLSSTPGAVLMAGLKCTLAAGLSWGVSLPALYILNSLAGSKLRASSTLLAALVTTSWGGLAMIASIPMNWFFTAAVPHPWFVFLVNIVVFTGVGISMTDVFRRVMLRLEPDRQQAPLWWLVLVGAIGCELFYFFGLFHFA